MKVSLEDLNKYRENLSAITNEAVSEFRSAAYDAINAYGDFATWEKDTAAKIRDEVAEIMSEHIDVYGEATQAIASNTFESVLEQQGESIDIPTADFPMKERANSSAHYWAKELYGEQIDVDAFVDGCADFVERHVSHSADDCLLEAANGKKYRKKLRYARVPSGPSCGFCIMLASRDFVYATPESAGEFSQWHSYCDCRVIAGYKGLSVEGYDPEAMRARLQMCREALGTPDDIWNDFQALSQEERDKYGRGKRMKVDGLSKETLNRIGHQADAFNDYYAHRITAEMNLRDRQWLYDGTIPTIIREKNVNPKKKELIAAKVLSEKHGFKVEFRATRSAECKKTSDFFFISGRKDAPIKTEWELKQPVGSGKNNIFNQFNEATGQSEKLIIDASMSPFSFDEVCKKSREGLKRREDFTEVIVINGEKIRHYKK